VTELHGEHGGLERIQALAVADLLVRVLLAAAMVAQQAHPVGDVVVVGDHHAAVAEPAEVLSGIEAEARRVTERADAAAAVARAVSLRRVLHDPEPARASDLAQWVHVARTPVQVHRHDRPRARPDGVRHAFDREVAGDRIEYAAS
jgi:fructose-specific component phosphotransferase system IIB-like protein